MQIGIMDPNFSTWALREGYLVVIAGFLTAGSVMAALVFHLYVQLRSERSAKSAGVPWKTKWPPSPPSVPILGHLHLLGLKPHISMHELSQKYGPLFYIRSGATNVIVISSPSWAKQVLHTHDKIFASRALRGAAVDIIAKHGLDIACAPSGLHWRHMRKVCMLELFSGKRIESFGHIRDNETRLLVQSIAKESASGKPVILAVMVSKSILNAVSLMTMGKRVTQLNGEDGGADAAESHEFLDIIYDIFKLVGAIDVAGDHFPWLRWLDNKGYQKKMRQTSQRFDDYVNKVIQHKRANKVDDDSAKDLLDVLLSLPNDNETRGKLSDDIVTATMLDILSAGTDTSSSTVEWALTELVKTPEKMKKAQQEIDAVVGKERRLEESDLSSLPYLEAVIKETFRLHPPAPLLLPHQSTEPCQIENGSETYNIPSGTRVYVNAWSMGRNPSIWENPMDFSPERFIETAANSMDVRGRDFELIPFGSGRRMCPGLGLGLVVTKFTTARLLHSFDFTLLPGQKPDDVDMDETFGLTMTKTNSLQVMSTVRDTAKLYQ